MSFGKDIEIADAMSDSAEGGAAIAWRLLATLEGGSLLLAASALFAYTARKRLARRSRDRRPAKSVLVSNTTSSLGSELKTKLEAHGCVVSTVTSDAISGAESELDNKVDALVVVGAEQTSEGLEGMANVVSEDVYANLKLLEYLSLRVRRGGIIVWACAGIEASVGTTTDVFSRAGEAFDTVLQASLQHISKLARCEPIWVGRCEGAERTAERVVAELVSCVPIQNASRFSIRNAANTAGEYLGRWLKILT